MKTTKLLLAILVLVIASSFIADAAYTIDPKSSSIAVTDVTDISVPFTVYNTFDNFMMYIRFDSVYTKPYEENVSFAHPLPAEFTDGVTVHPDDLEIDPNSSVMITVHLSLPDVNETYGNIWEFVVRFNTSDPYNELAPSYIDVPIRLYLPSEKIIKEVFPFWTYPLMIIGVIVFIVIIVFVTRRVRRPVAANERAQSGSEWSGTDMHAHDGLKRLKRNPQPVPPSEWEDIGDTPFQEQEIQEHIEDIEEEIDEELEKKHPVRNPVKKQINGKLPIIQPKIVKQPIMTQQRNLVSSSGIKKRYPIRMGDQR